VISSPQQVLGASAFTFTLWFVLGVTVLTFVLLGILIVRRIQWIRASRRREQLRAELEPVVSGLLRAEHPLRLEMELRPIIARLDENERPIAGALLIDLAQRASSSDRERLRRTLEETGAVELAEQGTRRRSPWRRALACEVLGKLGAARSVPVLLERLADRRPEVRVAAVRALGDIGSPDAVPALTSAFLERRCAPTNVVNDALRKIGGAGTDAFERGTRSDDPIVRISSCFGLAATTSLGRDDVLRRLDDVLSSDEEPRVRTAAAASQGIVGGREAPPGLLAAMRDPDIRVRRSAVKALGSFDDPAAVEPLAAKTVDEDRETALRAAEALLALEGARPRDPRRARVLHPRPPGRSSTHAPWRS
jgi:hypothetical protein